MLLAGSIQDGETVSVTVRDGHLAINGSAMAQAARRRNASPRGGHGARHVE
jgi:hypothetical protein